MAHAHFDSPLKHLKVLDLSRLLPGPFATLLLADMGAEVLKIEAPQGGDYARWYPPLVGSFGAFFASINRNKRSLALELKTAKGVEVFLRLAKDADVVLESFRPGVVDRLGIGFEAVKAVNPRVVYCSISGYGQDGPLAERAGHDLNYLALSGLLHATGCKDGAPVIPGFQLADIAGGALYAVTGILAALVAQDRQATFLDISMTEGALSFALPALAMAAAGVSSARGEGMLTGGLPCYSIYETADGRHLGVGALEPKFWELFVATIGLPELKHDGASGGAQGARVRAKVAEVIGSRSLDEWTVVLEPVDACVEPVLDAEAIKNHPQHLSRGVFFDIEKGAQTLPQTATPLTPRHRAHLPPPNLGEHSVEVLESLGYSSEAIAALRRERVIG